MNKRLSVVVPVYNTEKYLIQCLESLVQQTYHNYEVLLINDGSTDSSGEICSDYARKYADVFRVMHKENGGTSTAKNRGIEDAQGEIIIFVDADDYVGENYLKEIVEGMEQDGADLSVTGYSVVYESDCTVIDVLPFSRQNSVLTTRDGIRALGVNGLLNVDVAKGYKREILLQHHIRFAESYSTGEDLLFNCDYLRYTNGIAVKNISYYFYMRRETVSLVNKYREDISSVSQQLIGSIAKLYADYHLDEEIDKQNLANFTIDYLVSSVSNYYRTDCDLKFSEKNDILKKIFSCCDQYSIAYSTREDLFCKLFVGMKNMRNISFSNIFYCIIFFMRNHFKMPYIFFRNKIVYRNRRS